jgi:hypothetical protein
MLFDNDVISMRPETMRLFVIIVTMRPILKTAVTALPFERPIKNCCSMIGVLVPRLEQRRPQKNKRRLRLSYRSSSA